jgi:hypothetical protein
MIVLDTNVVSEVWRSRSDANVVSWFDRQDPRELAADVLPGAHVARLLLDPHHALEVRVAVDDPLQLLGRQRPEVEPTLPVIQSNGAREDTRLAEEPSTSRARGVCPIRPPRTTGAAPPPASHKEISLAEVVSAPSAPGGARMNTPVEPRARPTTATRRAGPPSVLFT